MLFLFLNFILVNKYDVDSLVCLIGNFVYENVVFFREGFKNILLFCDI